uniref:Uncharacterized protein n=1 Tax=Glossina pallidipes TaxID=7398 RepID=A0A1A9ZZG7_GLOPL
MDYSEAIILHATIDNIIAAFDLHSILDTTILIVELFASFEVLTALVVFSEQEKSPNMYQWHVTTHTN